MKLAKLMYHNFNKYYAIYIFIFAILSLVFAITLEYIYGFLPCLLCKIARIPLYFIVILGIFNFAARRKCEKIFTICSIIALFILSVISFYHAGVEYGIFSNFFDCVSAKDKFHNLAELRQYLSNKIAVPCDKAAFTFIFSLSGWNFFLAFTLGILGLRHISSIKDV